MQRLGGEIALVEKVSSLGFAEAMMMAWNAGRIFIPIDPANSPALFTTPDALTPLPLAAGGGWFNGKLTLDDSSLPAQVTFSSGTTGQPKPILISRGAVSDTCRRLIDVMGLDSLVREYVGVPITYSFGMARMRAIAAVGGASFLPDSGFRSDEFARMLEDGEINSLAAVPTLLRLIIQRRGALERCGAKLRWLEIGSQAMSLNEKVAIREIFPNARIVQHYGLTEASRTTFLRIDTAHPNELSSVGRAIGGAEVKIDDNGRICIRGPHLADGVITSDGVCPTADEDGWLRTADLGDLRDGVLYFLGRSDDLINVSGVKVPADYFEQRLAAALCDATGAVGVVPRPDPVRGEAVLVAHLASLNASAVRQSADAIGKELGLSPADINLWQVQDLPRTETGKLQRKELARRYAEDPGQTVSTEEDAALRISFMRALNRSEISAGDSFSGLAGDSLAYVQVSMAIERALGHLPANWEQMTIGEIEADANSARPTERRHFRWIATEMAIRPLAIALVVTSHALGAKLAPTIQGGALILLMTAGYNSARFQRDRMMGSDRWLLLGHFFVRLIIPYYLILGLYDALTENSIGWRSLALINNYWRDPGVHSMVQFWFIPVLFQCVALTILMFSFTAMRRLAARSRWNIALAMFVGALALKLLAPIVLTGLVDGRVEFQTHEWLYAFALGWLVNEAATLRKKLACVVVGYVIAGLDFGFFNSHSALLLCALITMLFFPHVKLWRPIAEGTAFLAQATFYVYLTQGMAINIIRDRGHIMSIPLLVAVAFAGGIITYIVWQAVLRQTRTSVGAPWGRWRAERHAAV